jgi:hypothetical protein
LYCLKLHNQKGLLVELVKVQSGTPFIGPKLSKKPTVYQQLAKISSYLEFVLVETPQSAGIILEV